MACDGMVSCVSVCGTMLVSGWGVSLSELVRSLSGVSNDSMEWLIGCKLGETLIEDIWGVIDI